MTYSIEFDTVATSRFQPVDGCYGNCSVWSCVSGGNHSGCSPVFGGIGDDRSADVEAVA